MVHMRRWSSHLRDLVAMQEALLAGTSFVIGAVSVVGLRDVGWLPVLAVNCAFLFIVIVVSCTKLSLTLVSLIAVCLGLLFGEGCYNYVTRDDPLCYVGLYMCAIWPSSIGQSTSPLPSSTNTKCVWTPFYSTTARSILLQPCVVGQSTP